MIYKEDIELQTFYTEMDVLEKLIMFYDKQITMESYLFENGYEVDPYHDAFIFKEDGETQPNPTPQPQPQPQPKPQPQPEAPSANSAPDASAEQKQPPAVVQQPNANNVPKQDVKQPDAGENQQPQNQQPASSENQSEAENQQQQQEQNGEVPKTNWQKFVDFVKKLIHDIAQGISKLMGRIMDKTSVAIEQKNEAAIEKAGDEHPDLIEGLEAFANESANSNSAPTVQQAAFIKYTEPNEMVVQESGDEVVQEGVLDAAKFIIGKITEKHMGVIPLPDTGKGFIGLMESLSVLNVSNLGDYVMDGTRSMDNEVGAKGSFAYQTTNIRWLDIMKNLKMHGAEIDNLGQFIQELSKTKDGTSTIPVDQIFVIGPPLTLFGLPIPEPIQKVFAGMNDLLGGHIPGTSAVTSLPWLWIILDLITKTYRRMKAPDNNDNAATAVVNVCAKSLKNIADVFCSAAETCNAVIDQAIQVNGSKDIEEAENALNNLDNFFRGMDQNGENTNPTNTLMAVLQTKVYAGVNENRLLGNLQMIINKIDDAFSKPDTFASNMVDLLSGTQNLGTVERTTQGGMDLSGGVMKTSTNENGEKIGFKINSDKKAGVKLEQRHSMWTRLAVGFIGKSKLLIPTMIGLNSLTIWCTSFVSNVLNGFIQSWEAFVSETRGDKVEMKLVQNQMGEEVPVEMTPEEKQMMDNWRADPNNKGKEPPIKTTFVTVGAGQKSTKDAFKDMMSNTAQGVQNARDELNQRANQDESNFRANMATMKIAQADNGNGLVQQNIGQRFRDTGQYLSSNAGSDLASDINQTARNIGSQIKTKIDQGFDQENKARIDRMRHSNDTQGFNMPFNVPTY